MNVNRHDRQGKKSFPAALNGRNDHNRPRWAELCDDSAGLTLSGDPRVGRGNRRTRRQGPGRGGRTHSHKRGSRGRATNPAGTAVSLSYTLGGVSSASAAGGVSSGGTAGVSGSDWNRLSKLPAGSAAAGVSSANYGPKDNGSKWPPANKRGDPTHDDVYMYLSLNASYVIKGKNSFYRSKYSYITGVKRKFKKRRVRAKF